MQNRDIQKNIRRASNLRLIPKKLRPAYEREIGGWKEKVQEKTEEQRMRFDKMLKEAMGEHED